MVNVTPSIFMLETLNIRHWCWWILHCFPPFVGEDDLVILGRVDFKVVRPRPFFDTVQLRLSTVCVCSWSDYVGVIGKFYHSVSWCYCFQVCRVYNVGCRPNIGSLDNACCNFRHWILHLGNMYNENDHRRS